MIEKPKIVIIGAGAAGIATASQLYTNGFRDLTILESENRIGGRIHTIDYAGQKIELGATWVHGENLNYKLAAPYDLLTSSKHIETNNFILSTPSGEILPKKVLTDVFEVYNKIMHELEKDEHVQEGVSVGDYFNKKFNQELEAYQDIPKSRSQELFKMCDLFLSFLVGSENWFDNPVLRFRNFKNCPGSFNFNWKNNGYSTLFDLLIKKYPNPENQLPIYEKIVFNERVETIDYSSDKKIKVTTEKGLLVEADHVISTIPIGVMKMKHQKLFKPNLPAFKEHCLNGFEIAEVNKLIIEFPHKWWSPNRDGVFVIWSDKEKENFKKTVDKKKHWICDSYPGFVEVDFQSNRLFTFVNKVIESMTDWEIIEDIHLLLNKCLGEVYCVPKPSKIWRSNWCTNPSFLGSYSFQSITTEKMRVFPKDLAEPIFSADNKPIVQFAGEATHDDYFSAVHGAVDSGFREANRLTDYYKNNK